LGSSGETLGSAFFLGSFRELCAFDVILTQSLFGEENFLVV
jgi:hypothetical protein